MTWLMVYLYNLREPMLTVGIICIIVCAIIAMWSSKVRTRSPFASAMYIAAVERQLLSFKAALGIGLLSAFIWAIPSPEYDVRYKIKEVTVVQKVPVNVYSGIKVVHESSSYQSIFDHCISAHSGDTDNDTLNTCHRVAIEASQPVRIVYRNSSFKELFDDCNSRFQIDDRDHGTKGETPAVIRNQRLDICRQMAFQGSH